MLAPCRDARSRAACSSSAGPRSFAGVLIRSRASATPSAMRERSAPSTPVGNLELRAVRIGLAVAGELVAAEREGERRKARIVRRVGEAIGCRPAAGRAGGRAGSGPSPACRRLPGRTGRRSARHRSPAAAATARPSARTSRSRRSAAAGVGEPLAHLRVIVGRDEPDRNRCCAVPRDEGRMHGKSPRGRPATTTSRSPEVAPINPALGLTPY